MCHIKTYFRNRPKFSIKIKYHGLSTCEAKKTLEIWTTQLALKNHTGDGNSRRGSKESYRSIRRMILVIHCTLHRQRTIYTGIFVEISSVIIMVEFRSYRFQAGDTMQRWIFRIYERVLRTLPYAQRKAGNEHFYVIGEQMDHLAAESQVHQPFNPLSPDWTFSTLTHSTKYNYIGTTFSSYGYLQ